MHCSFLYQNQNDCRIIRFCCHILGKRVWESNLDYTVTLLHAVSKHSSCRPYWKYKTAQEFKEDLWLGKLLLKIEKCDFSCCYCTVQTGISSCSLIIFRSTYAITNGEDAILGRRSVCV